MHYVTTGLFAVFNSCNRLSLTSCLLYHSSDEESKLPDLEEAKAEENEEANDPVAASLSKYPKSKRPLIRKIKAKRPIVTTGMHSYCTISFKAHVIGDLSFDCIQTKHRETMTLLRYNQKTTRRTTSQLLHLCRRPLNQRAR